MSKVFSKSINSNRPGISSSSNLSIKSYTSLVHSPIYLPFKNPFCGVVFFLLALELLRQRGIFRIFSIGFGTVATAWYFFLLVLELLRQRGIFSTRICISKKNRQCNGQKKKYKRTNKIYKTHIKLKNE